VTPGEPNPTKDAARLILPVWGDSYIKQALSITLPAVLAPGNLPAISEMFDLEFVIVTESRLFDCIRGSDSFKAMEEFCTSRFVAIDDLLATFGGDYGTILTHALFRGFADLGARMTHTYLLFLCADFVISDGSLRHLGQLMCQGKRLIHAPSFRVTLEDACPLLEARVDGISSALSVNSREMVRLALTHKHPTVKARTVNQELFHQSWMDQFYWYVDEDTVIGYQSPMALLAIKPERIVTEPNAFWDYGFIPEAAPTLEPYYITDSDNFFMIEPQARDHQAMLIRIGYVPVERLAQVESLRSTKEHRDSLRQLLVIHASDRPADLAKNVGEARAYMAEIYSRLSPNPAPHIGHPVLSWWDKPTPAVSALRALRAIYNSRIGSPPDVGKFHPLWSDTAFAERKLSEWRDCGKTNILLITASDWLAWRYSNDRVNTVRAATFSQKQLLDRAPFDACICELTLKELTNLKELYGLLRPLIKNGGQILFKVSNSARPLDDTALLLDRCRFPDIDVSEVRFHGTLATAFFRALYFPAMRSIPSRPITRAFGICALILLAPLVWLANTRAERRNAGVFSQNWTTLLLEFTVKRAPSCNTKPLPPGLAGSSEGANAIQ
jgi:hypothetical protein